MPDITMCSGTNCISKKECYRHTATPSEYRQSYFMTAPVNVTTQGCGHFAPKDQRATARRDLLIARWKPENATKLLEEFDEDS